MKLILVGYIDEDLRSTLELILKHWGYRVMAAASKKHLEAFLHETKPDLLILDSETVADLKSEDIELIETRRRTENVGLIILERSQGALPVANPDRRLGLPLNVFALFEAVQDRLEKYPRKNLRIDVKLPGMISSEGEGSLMGQVLSLSPKGLFIKVGFQLKDKQKLQIIIPLIGIHKELELEGEILYQVNPTPENNYMQGVGIGFTNVSEKDRRLLQGYLESQLLSGLQESDLDSRHIHLHDREITIKLMNRRLKS